MIRRIPILALGALIALLIAAPPGGAEAQERRTRTFKLVKPPQLGVKRRLTIATTHSALPPQKTARIARHGWFWRQASTGIGAANPERFAPLAAIAAGKLNGKAQRALISAIRRTWRSEIATAARAAGVSEALLLAVIAAESAGDPRAVSPAGAQGLGQLMPDTARRFEVEDPFEPAQNLRGAATYLSTLLAMFDEDPLLALAGYNAGENAVLRHRGVPPYAETRDYVPIVLSFYHEAQSLCDAGGSGPRTPCEKTESP